MELSKIENYGIDMVVTYSCPDEDRCRVGETCENCPFFKGLILTEGRQVEILCDFNAKNEQHSKLGEKNEEEK